MRGTDTSPRPTPKTNCVGREKIDEFHDRWKPSSEPSRRCWLMVKPVFTSQTVGLSGSICTQGPMLPVRAPAPRAISKKSVA